MMLNGDDVAQRWQLGEEGSKPPRGVCNSETMQIGVTFNGNGSSAMRSLREVRRRCAVRCWGF
jgi:hypothetical protein